MIRLLLVNGITISLILLAVRHWYLALCGLVLFTVLSQHPSMPTNVLGIPGLNPWNATLAAIVVFRLVNRGALPPAAPLSPGVRLLMWAYILMIVIAGIAAALDGPELRGALGGRNIVQWAVVDGIINPLKYLLVGILIYDGTRTRRQARLALFAAVGSGVAYALLMFKSIKTRILVIDVDDARRLTDKLVGLFANDIGELLAFTFWSAICLAPLLRNRPIRWGWLVTAGLILPPFFALKSRAGFLALSAAALTLAVVRWRRLLLVFPVAAALTLVLVPSVSQRITEGISDEEVDWNTVSAGRLTNIWPPVLAQIMRSPLLGHGRYGILREQCAAEILEAERTLPTHPHNAYLEALLDTGLVGLGLCLAWLALLAATGLALVRAGGDPLGPAAGSIALVAVAAEVSAAIAGSSFFPSQSAVPALVAWGVTLRLHAEHRAWQARNVGRALHRPRRLRVLQGVP